MPDRRRHWTAPELARLRRSIDRKDPFAIIAEDHKRSLKSVYTAAHTRGWYLTHSRARLGADFEQFLRDRHRDGCHDPTIADEWGCHRRTVRQWRHRLSLPANPRNADDRRHTAKMTRDQCKDNGVPNLNGFQRIHWRIAAARRGWPPDCTPLMCDILDCLESGPKSRREICAILGKQWHRCKALTNGNTGLLHVLGKMALVRRIGRRPYAAGTGHTEWVYELQVGTHRQHRRPPDAA